MIVIDTSIVLKWFVAENDSDAAAALIGRSLIAPDLIVAELGNALWKKWRRGEVTGEQAHAALVELPEIVDLVAAPPLADLALALAIEFFHPVYDCFFVALAERAGVQLLTADEKLVRKLADTRLAARIETLVPLRR